MPKTKSGVKKYAGTDFNFGYNVKGVKKPRAAKKPRPPGRFKSGATWS